MTVQEHIRASHDPHDGTLGSYFFGFIASLLLTLIPYSIVSSHVFTGTLLISTLVICAIAQLTIQMTFFLHLSGRSKSRWNLIAFAFTAITVWILVIGSLWIMNNLARTMTPAQVNSYMYEQN